MFRVDWGDFLKMFLKEVSSAHKGCIYLIQKQKKRILWNIITVLKRLFSMWI